MLNGSEKIGPCLQSAPVACLAEEEEGANSPLEELSRREITPCVPHIPSTQTPVMPSPKKSASSCSQPVNCHPRYRANPDCLPFTPPNARVLKLRFGWGWRAREFQYCRHGKGCIAEEASCTKVKPLASREREGDSINFVP